MHASDASTDECTDPCNNACSNACTTLTLTLILIFTDWRPLKKQRDSGTKAKMDELTILQAH